VRLSNNQPRGARKKEKRCVAFWEIGVLQKDNLTWSSRKIWKKRRTTQEGKRGGGGAKAWRASVWVGRKFSPKKPTTKKKTQLLVFGYLPVRKRMITASTGITVYEKGEGAPWHVHDFEGSTGVSILILEAAGRKSALGKEKLGRAGLT